MPWTTKKYPAAMKKLTAAVRAKAIQIGNAILKEKKKVKESVVIATSIKKAKQLAGKSTVKKAAPKKRVAVKSKAKTPKKATRTAAKKTTRPASGKSLATAKRNTTTVRKKTIPVKKRTTARTARPVTSKEKIKRPRIQKSDKAPRQRIATSSPQEAESHGKATPGKGGMHPVSTWDSHVIESGKQHLEDVAYRQENLKVKHALAARKNSKRTYRMYGNR
jgi:uncharacterized protein YdaT